METTLYSLQGKESGTIALPAIFETKISPALMHEVVVGYLANQRAGTHKAKTRSEVSGGGSKPYKQKGTGNARRGSNRSPLMRGGGVIFGPEPRDYSQNIPQRKRRQALEMALTTRTQGGDLMVIEDVKLEEPKTKKIAEVLKNLKVDGGTVLLVVEKVDRNLKLACRNVENLVVAEGKNLNMYQVMWAKKVLVTSSALGLFNGPAEGAKK